MNVLDAGAVIISINQWSALISIYFPRNKSSLSYSRLINKPSLLVTVRHRKKREEGWNSRLWVKCGIAECGMRKVKCGIKNAE